MITIDNIGTSYQFFYSKVYNVPRYEFKHSPTTTSVAQNFIKYLSKVKGVYLQSLGPDFLWRYNSFQFSYWADLDIQNFNKQINFSFIYGKKALDRYFARNKENDWLNYESRFLGKYNLDKVSFTSKVEVAERDRYKYNNPVRAITLNTDDGLNNCLSFTSLYDSKDISCALCKYKDECKELLRVNFPKIYRDRGYGRKVIS